MTFTVPAALKRRVQARRDVNWSAVVAAALEEKLLATELADRLTQRLRNLPVSERTYRRIRRDAEKTPAERVALAAELSDEFTRR